MAKTTIQPSGRPPLRKSEANTGNNKGSERSGLKSTSSSESSPEHSDKSTGSTTSERFNSTKIAFGIISMVSLLMSSYSCYCLFELHSPEFRIMKEVFHNVCPKGDLGGELRRDCVEKIKNTFQNEVLKTSKEGAVDQGNVKDVTNEKISSSVSQNNNDLPYQFADDEIKKLRKIIAADDKNNFIKSFPEMTDLNSRLQFLTIEDNLQEVRTLLSNSKRTQLKTMLKFWDPDENDIRELKKFITVSKEYKFTDEVQHIITSSRTVRDWDINSARLNVLSSLAKTSEENGLVEAVPELISMKNKLSKWNIEASSLAELSQWAKVSNQNDFVNSLPSLNGAFAVLKKWNPQEADITYLQNLQKNIEYQYSILADKHEQHMNERLDQIHIKNKNNVSDLFSSNEMEKLRQLVKLSEKNDFMTLLPELKNMNSHLHLLTQNEDNIQELLKLITSSQKTQLADNLPVIRKMVDRLKDWEISNDELEELKNWAVSCKKNDYINLLKSTLNNFNISPTEKDKSLIVSHTVDEIHKRLNDKNSELYKDLNAKITTILEKSGMYRSGYSHHFSESEINKLKSFVENMDENEPVSFDWGIFKYFKDLNPQMEDFKRISDWIKVDAETNFFTNLPSTIMILNNLTAVNLNTSEYNVLAQLARVTEQLSLIDELPQMVREFKGMKSWLSSDPNLDELSALSKVSYKNRFVEQIPKLKSFSPIISTLHFWNPDNDSISELKKWVAVSEKHKYSDELPQVIASIKTLRDWNPDHQKLNELTDLATASKEYNLVRAVPQLIGLKTKFGKWNIDSSSLSELSEWAKTSEKLKFSEELPLVIKSVRTLKEWDPDITNLHELNALAKSSQINNLVDAVPALISMKEKFQMWNIKESLLSELTQWAEVSKQYRFVVQLPSMNELFTNLKKWNPQIAVLEELTKWSDVCSANNYVEDLSSMKDIFKRLRNWNPSDVFLNELTNWADVSGRHRFVEDLPHFRKNSEEKLSSLDRITNTFEKKLTKLENHVYDLRAKDDMKSGYFSSGILVLVIAVACVALSTLFMWNMRMQSQYKAPVPGAFIEPITRPRSPTPPFDEDDVIYPRKIKSVLDDIMPRPLDKKICMISFYRETQSAHHNMLEPVISGGRMQNIKQDHVIINKHEQIKSLPSAMVYLVFVDYNQRHVILENPDLGLGDLRLMTVRAAKKIGGEVMLFYVGDEGSRSLNTRSLFNTNLTSIFRHEELKTLKSRECVVTAWHTLTNYQEQHVRNFMRNILL